MPTVTLTKPEFCFLSIVLVSDRNADPVDLITWRQLITTALTRDHGLLGSSIHVDILHQDTSEGDKVILRVARVNKRMVWSALGGSVDGGQAIRVLSVSDHLVALL